MYQILNVIKLTTGVLQNIVTIKLRKKKLITVFYCVSKPNSRPAQVLQCWASGNVYLHLKWFSKFSLLLLASTHSKLLHAVNQIVQYFHTNQSFNLWGSIAYFNQCDSQIHTLIWFTLQSDEHRLHTSNNEKYWNIVNK